MHYLLKPIPAACAGYCCESIEISGCRESLHPFCPPLVPYTSVCLLRLIQLQIQELLFIFDSDEDDDCGPNIGFGSGWGLMHTMGSL